ncbi:hypothetical protein DNTS_016943 [Danionella cerebrum]|uniref:KANL2-like probable zinc-finger domain-containing protein n=1 Tax=Danionella cerebrum TaxID=2873325 RepID=A0A553QG18_9TELE|nr:hypothetical protein DNTS_016943 [Danionella translucida]
MRSDVLSCPSPADVLRDQSHVMYEGKHIHFSEVDNKPLCSYSPKLCKQRRLNGFAFCIRHVLEDRTAPFKQCEYVAKYNSQRCTNPIPKAEERRYCNSHLQVLGFIPKKERKKKPDVLDESRPRAHVESVALNITLPSLALRDSNGLPASPPLVLSDSELLDPFAFYEEDSDGGESGAEKIKRSAAAPTRPVIGLRVTARELEPPQGNLEHFIGISEPCKPPSSPPQPLLRIIPPSQNTEPPSHTQQGSTLCKAATPEPVEASPLPTEAPQPYLHRSVVLRPSTITAPPVCLLRVNHLVQLYAQRQKEHGDLFPHLGLDWSEDSAEDEETEDYVPFLPQERSSSTSSEKALTRQTRLARLCSYLRQRYTHLCRCERAVGHPSRYRYALRKALLHAASREPECTAQLLLSLQRGVQKDDGTSSRPGAPQESGQTVCTGITKGQSCCKTALPYSSHCFQHILLNRSQQLFSSCTARFADGQQCSVPVFDITHQTPLCDEHAKKMVRTSVPSFCFTHAQRGTHCKRVRQDNFLRGDGNRRSHQHHHHHHQHQQQQQQHHPHNHQSHHRQQPRRPRKKTKPPALTKKHKKKKRRAPDRPQKPIPPAVPQGNLLMPPLSLVTRHAHVRSPSTPDLSADDLPDDITDDMADIPHDLELNQEDFSDVLPRLPDDLQDFDLFEGKNGELLPTTEEAEELVRALQAMGSLPESLACLSQMGEMTPGDEHRSMAGFSASSGVAVASIGDLLNARLNSESFPSLELEGGLLHAPSEHHFSASPPAQTDPNAPSPASERTFPRSPKPNTSQFGPTPSFQAEPPPPLLMEVPAPPHRSSWSTGLALSLSDSTQFNSLLSSETHLLLSTALSTPPSTQPPVLLPSSSSTKLQLPQFSAAFGQQLASHSGIPKDLHPSHSSMAPPTGFSITSATAATPPFPQRN